MLDLHLIDYDKCHEYARSLCGQYGIPRCDAEDVGSDAFVESVKRAWRTEADTNPVALANRLMYTSVLNVINRRNTHASKIIREADDISQFNSDSSDATLTLRTDDDDVVDDARSCEAVARTPTIGVNFTDDWQNPLWLRLFNNERRQLRRENKKLELRVIKAGLKDSRLSLLCYSAKISWRKLRTILDFFQERFDLCFQALRAWRAEI